VGRASSGEEVDDEHGLCSASVLVTGRGDLVHRRRTTLPLLDKVKQKSETVMMKAEIGPFHLAVSENAVLVVF
jgi:hypothetical protein